MKTVDEVTVYLSTDDILVLMKARAERLVADFERNHGSVEFVTDAIEKLTHYRDAWLTMRPDYSGPPTRIEYQVSPTVKARTPWG